MLILGIIIGGIVGVGMMCTLQISRDNTIHTVDWENQYQNLLAEFEEVSAIAQAQAKEIEELKINMLIQAGDSVKHKLTGETWYVLGVNHKKNKLCVAGWPPSIAHISDCILDEKGNGTTQEEIEYREKHFGTDWE